MSKALVFTIAFLSSASAFAWGSTVENKQTLIQREFLSVGDECVTSKLPFGSFQEKFVFGFSAEVRDLVRADIVANGRTYPGEVTEKMHSVWVSQFADGNEMSVVSPTGSPTAALGKGFGLMACDIYRKSLVQK